MGCIAVSKPHRERDRLFVGPFNSQPMTGNTPFLPLRGLLADRSIGGRAVCDQFSTNGRKIRWFVQCLVSHLGMGHVGEEAWGLTVGALGVAAVMHEHLQNSTHDVYPLLVCHSRSP